MKVRGDFRRRTFDENAMNIKAVAERANVSTATVSQVINGTAKVSPRTAERVQKAIKALTFYPDTNARALGSGRSNLFGLIISDHYETALNTAPKETALAVRGCWVEH